MFNIFHSKNRQALEAKSEQLTDYIEETIHHIEADKDDLCQIVKNNSNIKHCNNKTISEMAPKESSLPRKNFYK